MDGTAALEELIDRAGRQQVFDYARYLGWSVYNSPPPWVWQGICAEILKRKRKK